MMENDNPSFLHMGWLSDYFWIFVLYTAARIRAYGFRQSMFSRQITAQSSFGDCPRHPKLSSHKVILPSTLASSTLLFKTRPINYEGHHGLFSLAPKMKNDSNAIGSYAVNDLVNLLDSPGCASRASSPWTVILLLPLRAVTDWLKHLIWILVRPVPWHYPAQSFEAILDSDTMRLAFDKAAEQDGDLVSKHDHSMRLREAKRILTRMASSTSVLLIRVAAMVVNTIFRHTLSGIYARRCQLSEIQSLEEANPEAPLIYLPLHRSHLDYILLTYLLYIRGMKTPQVAAGDNLNIPLFGRLLRGLGGFFIRRKIDPKRAPESKMGTGNKDFIYRGVLQQFICEVLSQGYPFEFYLEGGRSRNGRTLQAKAGILSVLIHAYQNGFVEDAIIVPVAFTYDRLIEGNFVAEQCGSLKTRESLGHALHSIWRTMTAHFGSVRIEFGQPFNLKRFLLDNAERFGLDPLSEFSRNGCLSDNDETYTLRTTTSSASLISVGASDDNAMNRLTLELGCSVLREANRCLALSAPNIVYFLMATQFRKGCRESELVSAMSYLCKNLTAVPKWKMLTFDDLSDENLRQLCRYSTSLLRHLISSSEGRYNFDSTIENVIEIHYYSGPVMEALIGESVLAASLSVQLREMDHSGISEEDNELREVDWETVEKSALELCAILENEFIELRSPEESKLVIQKAKQCLVEWRILESKEAASSQGARTHVHCNRRTLQRISDLRASIAPLIEGYSAVANDLAHYVDSTHNICDRCLQQELLSSMQSKAVLGLLEYPEGCAQDTISNCLKLLRKLGIMTPRRETICSQFHLQEHEKPADEGCQAKECKAVKSRVTATLSQIPPHGEQELIALSKTLERFKTPLIIV